MELIPVGRTAVLAQVGEARAALALALWARDRVQSDEIVPAATTVLFDGVEVSRLREVLADWARDTAAPEGHEIEVPVRYDGPDLPDVGRSLGIAPDELVAAHSSAEHVVAFCGFAPGFPYVLGSPFEVPRRPTPRSRVEPGSVGLAGPYTGIYPGASPGGWQLIGRTDVALWDASRPSPALLPPGTRVRFLPA